MLSIWMKVHGQLDQRHRDDLLQRVEVSELAAFPPQVVRRAFRQHAGLKAALRWARQSNLEAEPPSNQAQKLPPSPGPQLRPHYSVEGSGSDQSTPRTRRPARRGNPKSSTSAVGGPVWEPTTQDDSGRRSRDPSATAFRTPAPAMRVRSRPTAPSREAAVTCPDCGGLVAPGSESSHDRYCD